MRNDALALLIDFNTLHDRVQNLPHRSMTPGWVLDRLYALIERLELLQLKKP